MVCICLVEAWVGACLCDGASSPNRETRLPATRSAYAVQTRQLALAILAIFGQSRRRSELRANDYLLHPLRVPLAQMSLERAELAPCTPKRDVAVRPHQILCRIRVAYTEPR